MSLVDTLVELVDIPSVTGDEEEICTALEFRLRAVRPTRRIGNSLVVGEPSGDRPLVVLYGHIDTVPAQDNLPARLVDGTVVGLGASDMKAGVAVMVHLLEHPEVADGPYDVVGVFYDKEEGPAADNGLEVVLELLGFLGDAELSIVLEPTDLRVEVGCNGVLNADVVFVGKAAHSARPWLGENAITKAGDWLAAMHRLEPEAVEIGGLVYRETYAVTRAEGGIANNVLPARFVLNLNHRFPPIYDLEEAEARLRRVAAAADEVIVKDRAPAGGVPEANAALDRLVELVGEPPVAKQGWTDVARLSARGIPAVNYGPGIVAQAHRATEYVPIANLERAHEVLVAFLTTS